MLDSCLYFFWPDGMMDKTLLDEDALPGFLLSSVYSLSEASDGKFVYFVASDPQRHALYDALGHPEWKEDPRFADMQAMTNPENFQAMGVLLSEAFATMTVEEVLSALVEHDVPCGPILEAEQTLVDPQVVHNESIVQWQHPLAGTVQQPRPAARFSETPAELAASGSLRGQDTEDILGELGRDADAIEALRASGVIA